MYNIIMYFKWVSENQMKGNKDKCHLLMNKNKSSEIRIGKSIISKYCLRKT